MVIQHNIAGMNANRQLNITTGNQAKSSEKLSSGYRINRAADDAAGLAISEKMRRQIRGLAQASENAQDGISMVQVADGAMNEVHDMLQRGNELAVKAANDTLTRDDRSYIQAEINKIIEEIDAINGKTTFNEIYVLKGTSTGDVDLGVTVDRGTKMPDWVGITGDDGGHMSSTYNTDHVATYVDFSNYSPDKADELAGTGFHFTCCTCDKHYSIKFNNGGGNSVETSGQHYIYNVDISGAQDANDIMDKIIAATDNGRPQSHFTELAKANGKLVVYDNRSGQTASGDGGRFGDGVAVKQDQFEDGVGNIILQVGSETDSQNQISLEMPYICAQTCHVDQVSVMSHKNALDAIESFKDGLTFVSSERSRMGAYQNRLEHTIKNLDNVVENTQDAESLIRDTDMASEMVKYSNNNILAQAGQSMLAQANQTNQGVLSLLQ
ncbi:flagellin N-terminal helical domain-containing protein [Butyrivibrio sp. VCB2006]|uniref:flagellin N-terminal helical domain-containing protein n=1 Tax=Butyrivibrio sp. VCB2006 TaxID=1280679 RepID=UPI0003FB3B85|nr:flagellin [Butyrivibrio sp. VCB2006]